MLQYNIGMSKNLILPTILLVVSCFTMALPLKWQDSNQEQVYYQKLRSQEDGCQQQVGGQSQQYQYYSQPEQDDDYQFGQEQDYKLGCKIWQWDRQICIQCLDGWVLNKELLCQIKLSMCLQFNQIGDCVACQQDFYLDQGQCIHREYKLNLCENWDKQLKKCLSCKRNWIMDQYQCTPVINFCIQYDLEFECIKCAHQFKLKSGLCVPQNDIILNEMFCKAWDLESQKCLQCLSFWKLNQHGICIQNY